RSSSLYPLSLHDALPILAEVLAPLVLALRIIRLRVELRLRLDELRRHGAVLPELLQRIEGRTRHVRRQLDGGIRLARGHRLEDRSEEHTSELQSRENLVC